MFVHHGVHETKFFSFRHFGILTVLPRCTGPYLSFEGLSPSAALTFIAGVPGTMRNTRELKKQPRARSR